MTNRAEETPPFASGQGRSTPWLLLGLSMDASGAEIRAAYLEKIRDVSQEKDPKRFEELRGAFRVLKDPVTRLALSIGHPRDDYFDLPGYLKAATRQRRHVGVGAWLAVLEEERR